MIEPLKLKLGAQPAPESARAEAPAARVDEPKKAPADERKSDPVNAPAAKPKSKSKKSGTDHVLQRARQMMRAEKRKLWAALGFDGEFDEAAFGSKLEELKRSKESTMTDQQRERGRLEALERENKALRQAALKAKADAQKATRELERTKSDHEYAQAEWEARNAARDAGLADPDYGIELFKRHCRELPENQDPDLAGFFSELKKDPKRSHLFAPAETIGAGPRPASEQSRSTQQGPTQGDAPKPPTPRKEGEPTDVDSLSPEQFRKHTRENYGYRVGSL